MLDKPNTAKIDPITFEVIRNKLQAITEEQAITESRRLHAWSTSEVFRRPRSTLSCPSTSRAFGGNDVLVAKLPGQLHRTHHTAGRTGGHERHRTARGIGDRHDAAC